MRLHDLRFGVLFVAASLVGAGCGSGSAGPPSPSRVEATVTGKVTANGVPVSKGRVTVNPPGPPFVENIAEIQGDGTYSVQTFVGKNSFSVSGTGITPPKGTYNKTSREVAKGSNTIDLALPLKDQ